MSDPFKNSGSLLAEGGTFGNFFSGAENSALKMETTMTSLGATEQGLVHAVDVALDSYDKALTTRNPAEIAKARARLEGLREELEKVHKNIMALDSMKRALNQPVDFATGTMAKTKFVLQQRAIDYRQDQFDKLQRTGALSK